MATVTQIESRRKGQQAASTPEEQHQRDTLKRVFVDAIESALDSTEAGPLWDALDQAKDLDDLDQVLVKLRSLVMQALTEAAMPQRGYQGPWLRCSCGGDARYVRDDAKRYVMLTGSPVIYRSMYDCPWCEHYHRPLDESWDLPQGRYSRAVVRAVAQLGAALPFARAAELAWELGGISISAREVQTLTERVGEDIGTCLAEEACAESPAQEPADVLLVEIDGTKANTREEGWKEVKVAATARLQRRRGGLEREQSAYRAEVASAEAFRPAVWSETQRQGGPGREETVVVGDGAAWIWDLAEELFPGAFCLLDYYHLSERVHQTGRELYGEGSEEGHNWAQGILGLLSEGKQQTAREQVEAVAAPRAAQKEAKRVLLGYLSNNWERLDYPTARARGYPQGSGIVESACKRVVGARHKQAGMRWSRRGLGQMLNVASYQHSDRRWREYWASKPAVA